MEIMHTWAIYFLLLNGIYFARCQVCQQECPSDGDVMTCGFNAGNSSYKMFPSKCALNRFKDCYGADVVETPLLYCVKYQQSKTRKMYGESCPVFCPSHYRPVCGANKIASYVYRTFTNGCYLDLINCRGDEDFENYYEVPLDFCQNHLMKNIFQEKLVMSNVKDYHDYM